MPQGTLNLTEPLNRNWGPNKHLTMRLLCLPNGQKGTEWRDIAGKNIGTFGTTTAAPTWSPSSKRKNSFGTINFDASNDYIDLGSGVFLTDNVPFSISWWEYIYTNSAFNGRFRLGVGSGSYAIQRTDNGSYAYLLFGKWGGGLMRASDATTCAASIGIWKHFTIVARVGPNGANASDFSVYEDGRAKTVGNGGGSGGTTFQNRIGYDANNPAGAGAYLDSICLWNRALSAGEAKAIFDDENTGNPCSLNWLQSPRSEFTGDDESSSSSSSLSSQSSSSVSSNSSSSSSSNSSSSSLSSTSSSRSSTSSSLSSSSRSSTSSSNSSSLSSLSSASSQSPQSSTSSSTSSSVSSQSSSASSQSSSSSSRSSESSSFSSESVENSSSSSSASSSYSSQSSVSTGLIKHPRSKALSSVGPSSATFSGVGVYTKTLSSVGVNRVTIVDP